MTVERLGLAEPEWERLVETLARAESGDDLDVLGLSLDAGSDDVKRAYLQLATIVHPGRFAHLELGEWQQRLERAYARLSSAHDTLLQIFTKLESSSAVVSAASAQPEAPPPIPTPQMPTTPAPRRAQVSLPPRPAPRAAAPIAIELQRDVPPPVPAPAEPSKTTAATLELELDMSPPSPLAATPLVPPPASAAPASFEFDRFGLSPAEWERLVRVVERAEQGDDLQVLGLSLDATVKDVKRAYFDFAALVHPDRFFGRDIGPWRERLEKAFARVTRAHDLLVGSVGKIAAASSTPAASPPPVDASPAPVGAAQKAAPPASAPAVARAEPKSVAEPASAASMADRRALLARKLAGGRAPVPQKPAEPARTFDPAKLGQARTTMTRLEYDACVARAKDAAASNNWGQAYVFAQAAASFRDGDADVLAWSAEVCLKARMSPQIAVDLALRAIATQASDHRGHLALAHAYEALLRPEMAMRAVENGIQLSTNKAELTTLLSNLRSANSKTKK